MARSGAPRLSVVVIGGTNLDVVAHVDALQPGVSNPGQVRLRAGGAGRNVAENLARLGVRACFVGAVGDDPLSDFVVARTARAGVDVSRMTRLRGVRNIYVAIISSGKVQWAVSDMAAAESLTPAHLQAQADVIQSGQCVVVDANLTPPAIASAVRLAAGRPLCLLPVSAAKASRMAPHLAAASYLVLGAGEAQVLAGVVVHDQAGALQAARSLRRSPGATAIVTMGAGGLVWAGRGVVHLPAPPVSVTDPSGAGDAVAAAAIYGLLAGLPEEPAARLALAAGTLAVTADSSTGEQLTLEGLYAHAQIAIDR